MRIRTKASLIFISTGWTLAFITGVIYYSFVRRVAQEITKEYFSTVIGLKQTEISNLIQIAQKQLIEISTKEIGQLELEDFGQKKQQQLLGELTNQLPYIVFGELAIIDASGSTILTTDPSRPTHYTSFHEPGSFQPHIVNHLDLPHQPETTIEFRTPIKSTRRLELVGHIAPAQIHQSISYHPYSQEQLKFYLADKSGLLAKFEDTSTVPMQTQKIIAQCLEKKPLVPVTTTTSAVVYMADIDACLSVFDSLEKEVRFNTAFRHIMGITLTVIAAVIALVVSIVSSSVGRSMQKLVETAERIAAGDLNFEVPNSSDHEISSVATSFKKICQNIKYSRIELEKRIAERTQTLNSKVKQLEQLLELTADAEINAEKMRRERDELLVQLQQLKDKRSNHEH